MPSMSSEAIVSAFGKWPGACVTPAGTIARVATSDVPKATACGFASAR